VWLNPPFFFGRVALFFALWMLLGRVLLRKHNFAAPFMAVFGVTFALASFDWVMSVEPLWFSTIFAIYGFSGMFVQAIALLTISAVVLHKLGLAPGLDKARNHDLGKMLFAFSCFWAYIWLSQFLLIWYANIPEETGPARLMLAGAWTPLFYLNLVINFGVPFFFLMRRDSKTNENTLVAVSLVLLVGHWLDLYLNIFPALTRGAAPAIGIAELGGVLLTLGLGHLGIWRRMTRTRPTLWQARYMTGSQRFDAQHEALLAKVNEIYTILELPEPLQARKVELAYRTFVDMARTHLREEEEYMQKEHIPHADRHAEGHAAFLKRLEFVLKKNKFGVDGHQDIIDSLALFRNHFEADDEKAFLEQLREKNTPSPS
jgi:hemerythrin-like metal-binding protein